MDNPTEGRSHAGRVDGRFGSVQAPRIEDEGWGRITVEGTTHKDAVLGPGIARGWDWRDDGTSHAGMAAAPVRELVTAGATHLLLSTGRQGRLTVPDEVVAVARDAGAVVEVVRTDEAIAAYRRHREAGRAVGAVLHTTC